MHGLNYVGIKYVICVYLIEKWIFHVYDYEVKLSMVTLYGYGKDQSFVTWF